MVPPRNPLLFTPTKPPMGSLKMTYGATQNGSAGFIARPCAVDDNIFISRDDRRFVEHSFAKSSAHQEFGLDKLEGRVADKRQEKTSRRILFVEQQSAVPEPRLRS
jgi:hypothetical protein